MLTKLKSFRNIIIVALLLVICFLPILFKEAFKNLSVWANYLSYIGAVAGCSTMFLAFYLYDKLDTKKMSFNKKSDAVDNLYSKLSGIKYILILFDRKDPRGNHNELVMKHNTFYLNFHCLENPEYLRYSDNKVVFSKRIIERIKSVSPEAHNPWLPKSIGLTLRPTIIFSESKLEHMMARYGYIAVVDDDEQFYDVEQFYSMSYGGGLNETFSQINHLKLDTFGDYLYYNHKMLNSIKNWYVDNFNETPDLQGDFNEKAST